MRVDCPWRDLPPNTVYKAYQHWFRSNKLIALFALSIKDSDCKWVFIDGTHIKAHQHSNGGNEMEQAISKSVVGRATKIHLQLMLMATLLLLSYQMARFTM